MPATNAIVRNHQHQLLRINVHPIVRRYYFRCPNGYIVTYYQMPVNYIMKRSSLLRPYSASYTPLQCSRDNAWS